MPTRRLRSQRTRCASRSRSQRSGRSMARASEWCSRQCARPKRSKCAPVCLINTVASMACDVLCVRHTNAEGMRCRVCAADTLWVMRCSVCVSHKTKRACDVGCDVLHQGGAKIRASGMRLLECMSCTTRGSRRQHRLVKLKSINKTRELDRATAQQQAASGCRQTACKSRRSID